MSANNNLLNPQRSCLTRGTFVILALFFFFFSYDFEVVQFLFLWSSTEDLDTSKSVSSRSLCEREVPTPRQLL